MQRSHRLSWLLSAALFAAALSIPAGPAPCADSRAARSAGSAPPASGSIEGVVLGPGGKPVADALVAAVPENIGAGEADTRAAAFARSARDGRFRLRPIPPGPYAVTATRSGLGAAYVGGQRVVAGSAVRGIKLQMDAPAGVFRGVVRDTRGRPVPGAQVRAIRYSEEQGDVFYTSADGAGRYEIALPAATYLLLFVADSLETETRRAEADGGKTIDVALAPAVPPGPAPPAVVDWIRANAIPLRTVEAGHGFSDMRPLRAVIGDARVVSLGEATHGTREFFQLKHRMLEFLVSGMGFTVFGIEASMPEGFDVNEYVLTGRGDPAKALAGLYFWTWDTEEVLDLIRWMRRWNADPTHLRKVKFYGFDMQSAPRAARTAVEYLRGVDAVAAATIGGELAPVMDAYRAQRFTRLPGSRRAEIASAATRLERALDERRQEYERRSSRDAWALARQHARILGQWAGLGASGGAATRDQAMAANMLWILDHEGPDAKMVVWAHNGHVSAGDPEVGAGGNGMGFELRKALGARMVVFGFAFGRGSFQAVEQGRGGLRSFTVGPAPEGSLDETLARAGLHVAAIDLRAAAASTAASEWLSARHPTRSIGAVFSDSAAGQYLTPVAATRAFDALLFVDSTTAARANPHGAARRPAGRQKEPTNLGFEQGTDGQVPEGWTGPMGLAAAFYRSEVTGQDHREGRRCARVRSLPGRAYGEWYGSLTQVVPAKPYEDRRVRVRASVRVRAESVQTRGYFWVRAWGPGPEGWGERAYDSTEERPIVADDWRAYTAEVLVPKGAVSVDYGLALVGGGTAWIDDVAVETVEP